VTINQTYWCADPDPDSFSKELMQRVNHDSLLPSVAYQGYRANLLLAYGHQYSSIGNPQGMSSGSTMSRGGEQGELLEYKVPILRSYVSAKSNIIAAPGLIWGCTAINSDSKSMAAATLGNQILEYLWKSGPYGTLCVDRVTDACWFGESFVYAPWDKDAGDPIAAHQGKVFFQGDITPFALQSWDVMRDPNAKAYDQCEWYAVRLYDNRFNLLAKVTDPELQQKILSCQPQTVDWSPSGLIRGVGSALNTDLLPVYKFLHKVTPAMPQGRMATVLGNGIVLDDAPLPQCYRKQLPLHRMVLSEITNTPYPYSEAFDAMGSAELHDSLQCTLATNSTTFGVPLISAESNSNLPVDQIGNGPRVIYRPPGTNPPVPLNFLPATPQMYQHTNELKQNMRSILNLNDMAVGQPESKQPNAQYAALLASMAVQANSKAQGNYVAFVQSIGKNVLKIFQQFATQKRKLALQGQRAPNQYTTSEFDQNDIASVGDVYVSVGNPLSQSPAGRMQLADMYSQRGFIQVPEQLQSIVETGLMTPLTQDLRNELLAIAEENEQLLKGNCAEVGSQDPKAATVQLWQSGTIHIREHKGLLYQPESRANPQISKAIQAHLQAHLDLLLNTDPRVLQVIGQAIPPPALPMPTAPGSEQSSPGGALPPVLGAAPEVEPITNPANGQPFSQTTPPL
jgi:hypothetical protein